MRISEIRTDGISLDMLTTGEIESLPDWQRDNYRGNQLFKVEPFKVEFTTGVGVKRYSFKSTFVFDSGSVPDFIPDIFADDFGSFIQVLAFCVHDAEYQTHYHTRKEADRLLKEILRYGGVGWFRRNLIYSGVRIGGWVGYSKSPSVTQSARKTVSYRYSEKWSLAKRHKV